MEQIIPLQHSGLDILYSMHNMVTQRATPLSTAMAQRTFLNHPFVCSKFTLHRLSKPTRLFHLPGTGGWVVTVRYSISYFEAFQRRTRTHPVLQRHSTLQQSCCQSSWPQGQRHGPKAPEWRCCDPLRQPCATVCCSPRRKRLQSFARRLGKH